MKKKEKSLQKMLESFVACIAKIKFTDKNISMYRNKKKELIVRINAGVI